MRRIELSKRPPPQSDEERRLIDEAVAAGKVRKVPTGIHADHDDAALYIDALSSKSARCVAAWLQADKRQAVDAKTLHSRLRRSRYAAHFERVHGIRLRAVLKVMVRAGYLNQIEPNNYRVGWRYGPSFTLNENCPLVDPDTLEVKRKRKR